MTMTGWLFMAHKKIPKIDPAFVAKSKYVSQTAEKSFCSECHAVATLLIREDGDITSTKPAFYICFACKRISQVGVGVCINDDLPTNSKADGTPKAKNIDKITA